MKKRTQVNAIFETQKMRRLRGRAKLLVLFSVSQIFGCTSSLPRNPAQPLVISTLTSADRKEESPNLLVRFALFERGALVNMPPTNLKIEIEKANIEFARLNQNITCFNVTVILDTNHTRISFIQPSINAIDGENIVVGQIVPKLGCTSFRGVTFWFDKSARNLVRTVYDR